MSRDKYETHVKKRLKEIEEWLGVMNDTQIALRLGISRNSLIKYKKEHPELREIYERASEALKADLKISLKQKALGFFYTETKRTYIADADGNPTGEIRIEEFNRYAQPDTGAAHLLLKNLDPTWRNDDMTTVKLKKDKMKLEQEKADNNNWT